VAPRPYWKGYLKLSLVSCPVAVHSATSAAERVSFRVTNRQACIWQCARICPNCDPEGGGLRSPDSPTYRRSGSASLSSNYT
jgi:hypothetical protein